jgi:hypothetical protein
VFVDEVKEVKREDRSSENDVRELMLRHRSLFGFVEHSPYQIKAFLCYEKKMD